MAKLTLSYIGGPNERVEPLIDGRVQAEGIEIIPTHSHPSETFWRQLNYNEFDFCEMSCSSFLIAKDQGADMVAIPAFPSRRFMHAEQWYHVDSGIDGPSSLAGKRVGVREYQQTSALWTRGVLEHDFGVSQYDIEWYMERTEEMSHGGATEFHPPEGIKFHRISAGTNLRQMLLNHEVDSAPWGAGGDGATKDPYAIGPMAWNFVDRETLGPPPVGDRSKIKPLFPDRMAEYRRFVEVHGYIPANHFFVVRGDIDEKYPWVAFNLYRALTDAKTIAYRDLAESIPSGLIFGPHYLAESRKIVGDDPFPYGMEANRPMLEFMIQMSYEQGLIKTKPKLEEIFKEEFHHV